jgi:hypothetical protein
MAQAAGDAPGMGAVNMLDYLGLINVRYVDSTETGGSSYLLHVAHAAAAIAAELSGQPLPAAAFANTCYSLIGTDYGISVAGVYRTAAGKLIEVPESGGVSPMNGDAAFRKAEADYGAAWYKAISADIWGS